MLLVPFSVLLSSLFLLCSLPKISRQRSILFFSRGVFLNIDKKQDHQEWTKGSVMNYLMAMLQNRLKYSISSAINDYYQTACQTKFTFLPLKSQPMKTKPLINEANLQKLSKSKQFLIRKPTLYKCPSQSKPIKNTQLPSESVATELKNWIEILSDLIQQDKGLTVEQNQKILKLLMQVREKDYGEGNGHEEQLDQSGVLLHKQSEINSYFKLKQQTQEEMLETNTQYPEESIYKTRKTTPKLKLGKENQVRSAVGLEVKIQRLNCKLADQEKILDQNKAKLKELSAQLSEANSRQFQLISEKDRLSDINNELHDKLSHQMLAKIDLDSKMSSLVIQHEQAITEQEKMIKILSQQLKDREKELISLFQYKGQ